MRQIRNGRSPASSLLIVVLLAASAYETSANTLPVSYVVESLPLEREVPPGTELVFDLYEDDPNCSGIPVVTQSVQVEGIEVREFIKPVKLEGNPDNPQNFARLNLVLSDVSLSPGADLFLKVTRSDLGRGLVPVGTDCQAQGISPGDGDTLGGLSCALGEVAKLNGSAWECAADSDTLGELVCGDGQVAKLISGSWECANDLVGSGGSGLSCSVVEQVQTIPAGSTGFNGAACQSPSVLTGGGVVQLGDTLSADVKILTSGPSGTNVWGCAVRNDSGEDRGVSCRAVCCTMTP